VALIGLRIEGFGAGSTTGIAVTNTAARVLVRGCDFTGLSIGINVTGGIVDLINNNIVSNTLGVRAQGPGLDQDFNAPGPGMVQQPTTSLVRLDGGNVARNATAFEMQDPGLAVSTANYRQNGGNNAQNIFLRTFNGPLTANIVGNNRFVNVLGNGEFNGFTSPNGVIGTYSSQSTNNNLPFNLFPQDP